MRPIFWVPSAAITAGTPFAPPSAAGAPRIIGVQNAVLFPATSAAATNPVMEAGVASGAGSGTSGAAGAGQITFDVATQQFGAGDAIAVSGAVFINAYEDGDFPVQS